MRTNLIKIENKQPIVDGKLDMLLPLTQLVL